MTDYDPTPQEREMNEQAHRIALMNKKHAAANRDRSNPIGVVLIMVAAMIAIIVAAHILID